jgi:hypothetical protein
MLRQIPDLQRFNFSPSIYFSTVNEISEKFLMLKDQYALAVIAGEVRSGLLNPRDKMQIATEWDAYLRKILA